MRIPTNHIPSLSQALKLGYSRDDIRLGVVKIGEPPHKQGQKLGIFKDTGFYFVEGVPVEVPKAISVFLEVLYPTPRAFLRIPLDAVLRITWEAKLLDGAYVQDRFVYLDAKHDNEIIFTLREAGFKVDVVRLQSQRPIETYPKLCMDNFTLIKE